MDFVSIILEQTNAKINFNIDEVFQKVLNSGTLILKDDLVNATEHLQKTYEMAKEKNIKNLLNLQMKFLI